VDGFGGQEILVNLEIDSGPGFEIARWPHDSFLRKYDIKQVPISIECSALVQEMDIVIQNSGVQQLWDQLSSRRRFWRVTPSNFLRT
jgi:hypothetical protein